MQTHSVWGAELEPGNPEPALSSDYSDRGQKQVPARAGQAAGTEPGSRAVRVVPFLRPLCKHPALSRAEWESQPQISTHVRAFNPPVRPFEGAQRTFSGARLSSPNRSDLEPHAQQECQALGSCPLQVSRRWDFEHSSGSCRPALPEPWPAAAKLPGGKSS